MNSATVVPDLQLAFDVGHSSIGWAVLKTAPASRADVEVLGCGAVIFRADDCLVSARRGYRRQRRHIRSTRQRIARMKTLLSHLGLLGKDQLDRPGCAWPWQLAARVLRGGALLSWPELWDVLRWYAHNRGYDGNRRWSAAEADTQQEDSEKEANARSLMSQHGTKSMCETFCRVLGVEPNGDKKASKTPFKNLNAAFPREVVEREVRALLEAHLNKLPGVTPALEQALSADWRAIPCPQLKLPRRYQGGLLFGQLVPRFENRIISLCPITWYRAHEEALDKIRGGDPAYLQLHHVDLENHDAGWWAKHIADKLAKVPSRNSPAFLNFRWAMVLANIRVGKAGNGGLRPLEAPHRVALDQLIRQRGYLTPGELKDAVRKLTPGQHDNLDTMLIHPDAKEALLLDPVQKLITSDEFAPLWKTLPERLQKRLRGQWRRGKVFSRAQLRRQLAGLADPAGFDAALQVALDARNSRARKRDKQLSLEQLLEERVPSRPLRLVGRAPFARPLLEKAYRDVLTSENHPKEDGGCLFLSEEIRQAQLNRAIAEQTNNHLVRHRLLILERLLRDMVKEYAAGRPERVARIAIEVNRDLREMSGKTAKEKAQDLGLRLANHHAVAAKLEESLAGHLFNGKPIPITAGLIRKARIADDLGWKCPYTGMQFEPIDLVTRRVDKDHIVPRSERASDSLDSLVLTFSEVNKQKGKRTAWQFVEQEQGKPVAGLPNLSITSQSRYRQFVEGLETFRGHDDDKRRKKHRKELLLLPKYEEKEFVPRDLTQTSQLVRLGAQVLRRVLPHLGPGQVISLPGSVTGEVRKAWDVLGCLSQANPQVLDETGQVRTKTEIRDITHLHHALDACVIGLASLFIPNNGRIWELIIKRHLSDAERHELGTLGVFGFNGDRRFELKDLEPRLMEQLRQRLAEKRVVQHLPARMSGLRVEQNTWGVVAAKDGLVTLRQRSRQPDGTVLSKQVEEKASKLLGLDPVGNHGKLRANKGVLVIPENYGVALDPVPTVIPFHKVWTRLGALKAANGGKLPRVLRNGQLIRVNGGKFKGIWRVFSAKNNTSGLALNMGATDVVRLKNKTEGHKINVLLSSLLNSGLEVLPATLTGAASPNARNSTK